MLLSACIEELSRQPWRGLLIVSAFGFANVTLLGSNSLLLPLCGGSWGRVIASVGPIDTLELAFNTYPLSATAIEWATMLVAMMPLVLAQPIIHVRRSVRRARRARSVGGFVLGYGSVWMLAGPLVVSLSVLAGGLLGEAVAPLTLFALALIWSASPWHHAMLNRAHQVPRLATFGLRADVDAMHYGLLHGGWCIGTCWVWMLVPMVAGSYHAIVMVLVAVVMVAERADPRTQLRWRVPIAVRMWRYA